jgi:carboxypeptidase C (cathepsin A)
MPLCSWGARQCDRTRWGWVCSLTLYYCQTFVFARVLAANPGINVYDIRKQCEGPLCYDFSDADAFLNSEAIRRALGVEGRKKRWEECDMAVHSDFMGDFMRDFSAKLVPLLEDNVPVMIYAGDKDLICNHVGNRRWVDGLEWSGAAAWRQAKDEDWAVPGLGGGAKESAAAGREEEEEEGEGEETAAGSVTASGPLTFVRVFGAGHMVPMDQPRAALHMISSFVRGKALTAAAEAAEEATAEDGATRA